MNSKERAYLRGLAMKIEPSVQIGKNGVTDNVLQEIDDLLEARELIKVNVLKNADFSAKDAINEIAKATQAEPVTAVGNKIVLYRFSKKESVKHILDL